MSDTATRWSRRGRALRANYRVFSGDNGAIRRDYARNVECREGVYGGFEEVTRASLTFRTYENHHQCLPPPPATDVWKVACAGRQGRGDKETVLFKKRKCVNREVIVSSIVEEKGSESSWHLSWGKGGSCHLQVVSATESSALASEAKFYPN